ncbi:MAG: 1-deoxy-D-xylulose-5-phosphate synthase, partial [Pseudomonadota bacterium]|nr:1-deoxy-D-xylulose-5-phosphate synthase [Pseudomonadota bacterium]
MQQSLHSPKSPSSSASVSDSAAQLSSLQQTYTVIPRVRPHTPLLDAINTPSDMNTLSTTQLITLADELRLFLL